ncbi:MAG: hypothetical protein AAFX04_07095 [Pseudomonadota bacterium]
MANRTASDKVKIPKFTLAFRAGNIDFSLVAVSSVSSVKHIVTYCDSDIN